MVAADSIPKRPLTDSASNPDLQDWAWLDGWEPLLGSPFVDGNTALQLIPVTPVRAERESTADCHLVLVLRNSNEEIIIVLSVFEFARELSDQLDARRIVLEMRLNGTEFMVRTQSSLRIASAGVGVRLRIRWGGVVVALLGFAAAVLTQITHTFIWTKSSPTNTVCQP